MQTNTQIKIQIQIEEQEQCQPAWQGAAIITCSTYRTGRAASLKVQTIIYYHFKADNTRTGWGAAAEQL